MTLHSTRTRTDRWRSTAHRRLARLAESVERLRVDDSSRILFLSDCHRGNGGPADDLRPNRHLYLDVLTHYYRQGFVYVEVGDGDELWKNRRLASILRAHRPVYELLQRFHQQERLFLIRGNHDQADPFGAAALVKDGIPTREGLVLQHSKDGRQVLVLHGHQVDFEHDPGLVFSRFGVRYFWRSLQQMGYWRNPNWTEMVRGRSWLGRTIARRMLRRNQIVEARLESWLRPAGPALLCGHTHVARMPDPGALPYLNTGCCIVPGQVTGIELENGRLSLVRWAGSGSSKRELMAPPRLLVDLWERAFG